MAKLDSLDISVSSKQSGQKFLTAFMPFKGTTRNYRNIFLYPFNVAEIRVLMTFLENGQLK